MTGDVWGMNSRVEELYYPSFKVDSECEHNKSSFEMVIQVYQVIYDLKNFFIWFIY